MNPGFTLKVFIQEDGTIKIDGTEKVIGKLNGVTFDELKPVFHTIDPSSIKRGERKRTIQTPTHLPNKRLDKLNQMANELLRKLEQ